MPAFNFKKEFAGLVESGKKNQTIRAPRKDGHTPRVGQTAYLYTGMCTKTCRKLCEGTITLADRIEINQDGIMHHLSDGYSYWCGPDADEFARDDGFSGFDEMVEWFSKVYGLPFYGFLIKWEAK